MPACRDRNRKWLPEFFRNEAKQQINRDKRVERVTADTESAPNGDRAGRPRRNHHGLGRGLSALLGETMVEEPIQRHGASETAEGQAVAPSSGRGNIQQIAIAVIAPNPDQPRRQFDEASLQELADSIAERGVIQPILLRERAPGAYQIVAGERRWRAAQRARLHQIPAIVRDLDDTQTLEIALIENIQRQDLNPVEEAEAYSRLMAQFGHSQEALGKLVGKSRSHVANLLRLLDLPGTVLGLVRDGALTMGHARALIGAEGAEEIARQIIAKGLSVRQTEKIAQQAKGKIAKATAAVAARVGAAEPDADIVALEQHLADIIGMKVVIDHGANGGGTLSLRYSTLDQLDMLCQRLSGERI